MKKPMLNAIQKARMSMAMKSKNPKMNPGFDSLPKDVQAKIMNKRKPKLSFAEARNKNVKVKQANKKAIAKRKAIISKVRKKGEAKVSAEVRDRNKRIGGRSVMRDPLPPRMSKKKKAKMGMKKAKASQTAVAIMKRERLMI
jgi:hypothetical protein